MLRCASQPRFLVTVKVSIFGTVSVPFLIVVTFVSLLPRGLSWSLITAPDGSDTGDGENASGSEAEHWTQESEIALQDGQVVTDGRVDFYV